MGYSGVHVYYVKDTTDEFKAKVKAYQSLLEADLEIPKELIKYFDKLGVEEFDIEEEIPEELVSQEEVPFTEIESDDGDDEIEINLNDIPQGVKKIRVRVWF